MFVNIDFQRYPTLGQGEKGGYVVVLGPQNLKRILTFHICFEMTQIDCSSLDLLYSEEFYVLWLNITTSVFIVGTY